MSDTQLAQSYSAVAPTKPFLEYHVDILNTFSGDGFWELGRYIAETVLPDAKRRRQTKDAVLAQMAAYPRARHTYAFLRQCLQFFTSYPDAPKRSLPEIFYFDLATRLFEQDARDRYEQDAITNHWNITQLRKAIRDGVQERRERERNALGFDLQVTNCWYFNSADPRFGKSSFRGRIAGQIIANALHFYAQPGDVVLDPFAGSGTLGDVIDKLECFRSLSYRMYDLAPTDARIMQGDVTLGLSEETGSIGYIFLDPPYGSIPRGYYTLEPQDLSRMNNEAFIAEMRGLIRECWRVLMPGGRASIVAEPYLTATSFFELPRVLGDQFRSMGFIQIGKAYLPNQTMRRGGMMPHIIQTAKQRNFMLSDCRELLSFEKPLDCVG